MKNIKLILDLLFITRPVVLVPVWGFVLFGYRLSSQTNSFFQAISPSTALQTLLFSLSVASVYVLNQIADRKVDEDNGGFPLLLKSGVSNRTAWIWAIILAVLSVVIPFYCGYKTVSALSLASIVIGIAYCFRPLSFSGKPVLDFLSNAFGYGTVAFAVGWVLGSGEMDFTFLRSMLSYFFLMTGGAISSTLPDYEGDKNNGKITTAVFFGKPVAHLIATFFVVATAVTAHFVQDPVAFYASVSAFPIYILYIIFPKSEVLMEACYKVGGAVSMLIIGLFFPVLIASGLAVAVLTLLYFRIFYKVSYPSLRPVKGEI